MYLFHTCCRKTLIVSCFLFSFSYSYAQDAGGKHRSTPTTLNINQESAGLTIKQNEERIFSFFLKKDIYYAITGQQKGIDLAIALRDRHGKTITKMDSPNGKFGPERIAFSPDSSGVFTLSVTALADTANSKEGKYSVLVHEFPKTLVKFSYEQLSKDFDILKNAFIETHVGLWYNTYAQFDSLCTAQKSKIKDQMDGLEFYRVIAPVVTYTKEGHCFISPSEQTKSYLIQNGTYFPFLVKILEGKVYITSNLGELKTKGLIISSINGQSIDQVMQLFYGIEPSDGYNQPSKYHWIETAFSRYYTRFFPLVKTFNLELVNPETGSKIVYRNIAAVSYKAFQKLSAVASAAIPDYKFKEASTFTVDSSSHTAVLTVNSFSTGSYKNGAKGFRQFLENSFKTIANQKIKHLIIDIRKNEGGQQGMEDHLLSYLINKAYAKYKYVEIPAFNYSFLKYSDDTNGELTKDLEEDFYRDNGGRYLNKKGHYEGDAPKQNSFKGDIYILISGLTFSGGSEFAALAKNYTNAKFIGEETGGGYYGNTSGSFIYYTLPGTKLTGRIPLCKFVLQEKDNTVPFGHGVIPDYPVQPTIDEYLNGHDAEMEYTTKLIRQK